MQMSYDKYIKAYKYFCFKHWNFGRYTIYGKCCFKCYNEIQNQVR